jgi:O-antigen ligase
MNRYNFKEIVLYDKVLLFFFFFLLINFGSYLTATLLGSTLVPVRIAFLVLLIILLMRDKLRYQPLDKINNTYIFVFLFFYCCSFVINIGSSDVFFFSSVFLSVIVFSLFIEYLKRHYKNYSERIMIDIIFYALLIFPVILILNPWLISLNLYGSNNIERVGLKSRYLGWSCAVIFGILLYQFKEGRTKKWKQIFLVVLFFFIVISGSRSSLLSVVALSLLYFASQKNKVKYILGSILTIIISVVLFSQQISNYSEQVSFQKRQEAREMGVSDESYRGNVLVDALEMSWENMDGLIFGFGTGRFKETLSDYYTKYRYNELSSHNTYLEVFITSGLLCFIPFLLLYVILPLKNFYSRKRELLYVFIPIILIAATEDNFGMGQFLFVIFSLLSFYSFKV